MSDAEPEIVYDPKLNFMSVKLRHNRVRGTPDHIEELIPALISALYEVRKGMHEAPPLTASTWRLKDIADG